MADASIPSAQVVCLKRSKGRIVQDCDVYIGRRLTMGGWNLQESKWANPFHVKDVPPAPTGMRPLSSEDKRAHVVELYREWILRQPHLLADLEELRGKRLGCWCKKRGDESCHGDVLVELLSKNNQTRKRTLQLESE